jgi:hypothetical protein
VKIKNLRPNVKVCFATFSDIFRNSKSILLPGLNYLLK